MLTGMGWQVRVVWECEIASADGLSNTATAIDTDLQGA
jgi:G:T-mismatch repair DNA endonuclease (very short patch repair protein)